MSPITETVLAVISSVTLPWPLEAAVSKLKDHIEADSKHRIKIMLETCTDEVISQKKQIDELRERMSAQELNERARQSKELLIDAARKASVCRSLERVQRIGIILGHAVVTVNGESEADEVEEMMRVAVDLSDLDLKYLRELVRIDGPPVKSQGRVDRYNAYSAWEKGFWGGRIESEIDSVFSKLESYGLVSRIPPPNNLNIMADFQNRYALLRKGMRFAELVTQRVSANSNVK